MFIRTREYPSSFRGARFWWQESDKTAGRKTVIHEYPGKNIRFVEDLGRNLPTFEIRAIIKGLNYFNDIHLLEEAMEQEGIGILVHPYRGNIDVYPLGYTVTEDQKQTGVATYTLRFAQTDLNASPRVTGDLTASIANFYRDLYNTVNSELNLTWTLNFIRNIKDAAQVMQRTIDFLRDLTTISKSGLSGRDTFNKSADNFERNKYYSAKDSQLLADNSTDLFSTFDDLTIDQPTRFDFNSRAYGIGNDDDFLAPLSSSIIEENKNRKLLNGTYNLLILNNLFQTATLLDYEDELQLDAVQIQLDVNFDDLLNNEAYFLTNTLRNQITEMRNQVRQFFDEQRLIVAKVTTITTQAIPLTILTYAYYARIDEYQEIIDLNNITNPAIVSGDLRILEEQASNGI